MRSLQVLSVALSVWLVSSSLGVFAQVPEIPPGTLPVLEIPQEDLIPPRDILDLQTATPVDKEETTTEPAQEQVEDSTDDNQPNRIIIIFF